jgi:hypothetical protein
MKKEDLVASLVTNLGLLLTGMAMAFSGFLIQFSYHMGHHGGIDQSTLVLGLTYAGWSEIHKISVVIISFLSSAHIILHWKWYKAIVRKKSFGKTKLVSTLTILFLIVAITGYIPWYIDLAGGQDATRKSFIEVHDKLTFILIVYLVIHVIRRMKWFITSFRKLWQSPSKEPRPAKTDLASVKR